jgi:CARDB
MNRTSIGTTWKLLVLSLLLALAATPAAFASDNPPIPRGMAPLPDLAFTTVHMRDHDELAVINRGFGPAGPFTVRLYTDAGLTQTTIVPGLAPAPIYGGPQQTYLVGEYMPLVACTAVRIDAENLVHESNETNNTIKNWDDVCGNLGW